MKSKFFTLFAAFVLLFSAQASAQANGDVNGDGKVDGQDIAAILEIMAEAGGVKEKTKYYWYVGTDNPIGISEIKDSDIANADNEMGWHLIGTELGSYSSSNMLHKGGVGTINIDPDYNDVKYYIALPIGIGIYDGLGNNLTSKYTLESTSTIMGVKYNVYSDINSEFTFNLY